MCFSHGSNDVGNAISPLLVIMKNNNYTTEWGYLLGSGGICIGIILLGKKVMITVGKNIVRLDY
jgi:PiT family inorganic phosphate transporter